MTSPSVGDQHVNALLTNFSVALIQKAENFAFHRAFSRIPVKHRSDLYTIYDVGDFTRDEAKERAPGTPSSGGDYDVDNTPSYLCRRYSFHKDVSTDEIDNSESQFDPKRSATTFVTQKMLISAERRWAAKYMAASTWENDYAGVTSSPTGSQFLHWNATGSTILTNIEDMREAVACLCGQEPNKIVISPNVFNYLCQAQEIKDTIQYSTGGSVTEELLARLFKVDQIIVPRGIYNSAKKGQTDSLARIVSNKVLMVYAPPNITKEDMTAGMTFEWTGKRGASQYGTRIKDFFMDDLDSWRIEGDSYLDFAQTYAGCGFYFGNVLA